MEEHSFRLLYGLRYKHIESGTEWNSKFGTTFENHADAVEAAIKENKTYPKNAHWVVPVLTCTHCGTVFEQQFTYGK